MTRPVAWAVYDAVDRLIGIELSRVIADETAERTDGGRVVPLVPADTDGTEGNPL